jgi:hypothetical protein
MSRGAAAQPVRAVALFLGLVDLQKMKSQLRDEYATHAASAHRVRSDVLVVVGSMLLLLPRELGCWVHPENQACNPDIALPNCDVRFGGGWYIYVQ